MYGGKGTENLQAYLKYLQAREALFMVTKEGNIQARRLSEEAIALDPQYAAPYGLLSSTHFMDVSIGASKSPGESIKLALELAKKSQAMDETRAIPQLGFIYILAGRQYDKAIAECEKAIALAPNSADCHSFMAIVLMNVGRHQEAVQHAEHALRLDPIPAGWYYRNLGQAYFYAGRYEDAIATLKKSLSRTPKDVLTHLHLTTTYSWAGRHEEARAQAEEVLRINPKISLEERVKVLQYKNLADVDRYLEGLRKAGIPEKPPLPLADKPSIAVLPFVNMSDDREQEFFSDGMTEELIGALAKLEGFKVISRTSVFTFKGKQVDLRTIGEKLGVDHVLEGSVRRAGDKLRITAQLINVSDDSHLWAETYDRNVKDVFDIQDEISRAVVTRLRVKLLDKGDRKLIQSSTENPQAQDLYFKGLSVWNRREAMKAIEYLEQSISLDPNNARAYALLATVYSRAAFMIPYPPRESYGKAKAAAAKALEIDNMLAEAHIAVGVVKIYYEYDWVGAEKALIRAIEINPGLGSAHFYYSLYHIALGHTDEAMAELKRAFELDPLATHVNNHMAFILISARQYEQAIQCCQRALEVNPNDSGAIQFLGLAYAKKGMCEEAISVLQKGVNLFPKDPIIASTLGFSYGVAGKRDEAQKIINGFMDISKKKYFSPQFISRVYAGMGEVDKAIEWLEKAYEERDPTFCFIKSVPSHDYMHSDPRFKAILKKMGLAE